MGRPDLADRVQWTASAEGDGLGYDVQSYDAAGDIRYIEVKATAYGPETPFYISTAELEFARRNPHRYRLYRVFDVLEKPRFFTIKGDITTSIDLTPVTYQAMPAATVPAANHDTL
jgi:hypothetical protein